MSFVLSWYRGINLDQLEHLHKDGLSDVDLTMSINAHAPLRSAQTPTSSLTWVNVK
jgi:hypothetical protein